LKDSRFKLNTPKYFKTIECMDLIVSETVLKCYDIVNIKWDRYVKKMHQLKRN